MVRKELTIAISQGSDVPEAMELAGKRWWRVNLYGITGSLAKDARDHIDSYMHAIRCSGEKPCVKELWILGHGCPGVSMTIGVGPLFTTDVETLFKGVEFCEPCEIWLHSCDSGVRPSVELRNRYNIGPNSLAEEVARITKCVTYGTKGYIKGWGKTASIMDRTNTTVLHRGEECWEKVDPCSEGKSQE